jgi:hypothetical protein
MTALGHGEATAEQEAITRRKERRREQEVQAKRKEKRREQEDVESEGGDEERSAAYRYVREQRIYTYRRTCVWMNTCKG